MAIDFEALQESPHLLDILVQMEDVLDSFDLYVFKNWIKGEVVEGPSVRRYWFDFTLRYPIDQMPDPKGAMRLLKHGVRINYEKATVEKDNGDEPMEEDATTPRATHWEIKISIPRRLISDMNSAELDIYDGDIEIEDVQDAQDSGMNDETGYTEDGEMDDLGGEEEEPDAPF